MKVIIIFNNPEEGQKFEKFIKKIHESEFAINQTWNDAGVEFYEVENATKGQVNFTKFLELFYNLGLMNFNMEFSIE